MTDTTSKAEKAVANPLPQGGDHDRVAMLSLKADGTPDQVNPEFIGDPEQTKAATTAQFVQQAVSAADVIARGTGDAVATTADSGPSAGASPQEQSLQDAHDSAAASATAAAEAAVAALTPDSKGK